MWKDKLLALYDIASKLAEEKGISHREAIWIATELWDLMERAIEFCLLPKVIDEAAEEWKRRFTQFIWERLFSLRTRRTRRFWVETDK